MKKLVLTLVVGLFFVTFSNAQSFKDAADKKAKTEIKANDATAKTADAKFEADAKEENKANCKGDKNAPKKSCKTKAKGCATKAKGCASKRPDSTCKH
jgi:hypothetical protein